MSNEADRRDLFVALEHSLGAAPAATLMDLLPPNGWDDVARRNDIESHAIALRSEMSELRSELRSEMSELRSELRSEMSELRSELRSEMSELRGEMFELRGELAKLDAKVDGLFARLLVANVPMMFGVAALVLAAAKLG